MAADPLRVIPIGPATTMTHTNPSFERVYALTLPTQCPTYLAREARILARENQKRQTRARWVGRLIVGALVLVLGALAFYRFGSDPLSAVQPR